MRRRASFSTRFALILAVLGVLMAGATAAIPLDLAANESKTVALDRAADKVTVADHLVASQRRSLQVFAGGVAAQLGAPLAAGDMDGMREVLARQSQQLRATDLLGTTTDGFSEVMRSGTPLAAGDPQGTAVVRATAAHQDVAIANRTPWLLVSIAIPGGAQAARTFVARPMDADFVSRLSADLGSGADSAQLALVYRGRYAVDSAVAGHAVRAEQQVPPSLAPVLARGDTAVLVSVDGSNSAAASRPMGAGVSLLVTTAVRTGAGFVSTVVGPVAIIAAALILVALIVVFGMVQRDLQRPLRRLDRAVAGLEREDFDVPIPAGTEDEIGRLGLSFERMRRTLRAVLAGAEARAAIASELNAAQPLQVALQRVARLMRVTTDAHVALIAVGHSDMADAFIVGDGSDARIDPDRLLTGAGPVGSATRLDSPVPLQAVALPGSPESEAGLHDLCAAPLRIGSRVLGAVAIADKEGGFNAPDVDLVGAAAEQVALALERYRILAVAQRQASTDELTGLYNYRFLVDYLDQQIALAERHETPLTVLMLDLDRFKQLNDGHGHHAGDAALRAFAETLIGTVRRADLAARYGGEEFVVVMSNTGQEEARGVAEKLRRAVGEEEIELPDGTRVRITVSIGGVTYPDDTGSARDLLRLADDALYRAKRGGRDRVCFVGDTSRGRTLAPATTVRHGRQEQHEGEDERQLRGKGHRPSQ